MLRVTRTIKRPTIDTSWFIIPVDLHDEYLNDYVYAGKILSTRLFMSDDQLEMKVITLFADRDAFDSYTTLKPWKNMKDQYDLSQGITETDPVIETIDDTHPYVQEFLFDFSIINHPHSGGKNNVMDSVDVIVEPRNTKLIETHDPEGPGW